MGIVKKIRAPVMLIPSEAGFVNTCKTMPNTIGSIIIVTNNASTILKRMLVLFKYYSPFFKADALNITAMRGNTNGITTATRLNIGTR